MPENTYPEECKERFKAWLLNNRSFSQSQIRQTIQRLYFLPRFTGVGFNFTPLSQAKLRNIQSKIMTSPRLQQEPSSEKIAINNALQLFNEFCFEEKIRPIEHNKESGELSSSVEVTAINHEQQNASPSPLEEVLQKERYKPLVEAFKLEGILSIDQVKNISLFAFMNKRDLYHFKDRSEIAREIQTLIGDSSPVKSFASPLDFIKEGSARPLYKPERETPSLRKGWEGTYSNPNRSNELKKLDCPIEQEIAEIVKKAGIKGISNRQISLELKNRKASILNYTDKDKNIIEIKKDCYVHKANIIDTDEISEVMLRELTKLFKRFDGYASAQIFYNAVKDYLILPLNDNGLNDVESVYWLAKHFFQKEKLNGYCFEFYNIKHIWQNEPDYPKSMKGLAIHYARKNQRIVSSEDYQSFFEYLSLDFTSINQLLGIGRETTFLQYDRDRYLLTEFIPITGKWEDTLSRGISKLFESDYFVILRDIHKGWYSCLPELPFNLPWTPLLLQEIVNYIPQIGYRTIQALPGQRTDTLHAALVPADSGISTFADFVAAFFQTKRTFQERIHAEELRQILKKSGVIEGNELISNMHKALDDRRFAWSNDRATVLLNVGV